MVTVLLLVGVTMVTVLLLVGPYNSLINKIYRSCATTNVYFAEALDNQLGSGH